MDKRYKGLEGCLQYISDISDDYDGCGNNVKELKELIDEIIDEAYKGLEYKDKYYVPCFTPDEMKEKFKIK